MTLDITDLRILFLLQDADGPLWKNKIHEKLDDLTTAADAADTASVQTVGRRVDQLNDNGYLDNQIVSPEELKRDLIIGFEPTEKGVDALDDIEVCEGCESVAGEDDHQCSWVGLDEYFSG